MRLEFWSYCAGIEAASVAFHEFGWKATLLSEIEAFPRAVLAYRLGAQDARRQMGGDGPALWGDFTSIRIRHAARLGIPLPRMLCGGTPCQAFSFAGNRASLADARGNLTLEFIRQAHAIDAARAVRGEPGLIVLWENVPGVLSTDDNAFGCFLGGLVGHDDALPAPHGEGRWPDEGMVEGPGARAAWRVLDAQYFGLAQRRRRVFVVAGFRAGLDPAAVLFEPQGVSGNSPPRREAGEGVAGTIAGGARRNGGYSTDDIPLTVHPLAFGGGNTKGPIDVAATLTASRLNSMGFEVENFVIHSDAPTVFSIMPQNSGRDYKAREVEVAQPLMAAGLSLGNQGGDVVVQPPPIAFALRGRDGGALPEVEGDGTRAGALRAAGGGSSRDYVAAAGRVRRFLPVECERLQGFTDGHTCIPWKGKPAEECPDGPRYKALGNSWPVDVVRWIGGRINAQLDAAA